jgi:hypothetical protein
VWADDQGNAWILDVEAGALPLPVPVSASGESALCVAFARDGRHLISASVRGDSNLTDLDAVYRFFAASSQDLLSESRRRTDLRLVYAKHRLTDPWHIEVAPNLGAKGDAALPAELR